MSARALWIARAGFGVAIASCVALALLLTHAPESHWSRWGANPAGARALADAFGVKVTPAQPSTFVILFRGLLAAAWAAYGIGLVAATRARAGRLMWPAAPVLLLALLFPVALSCDVHAYIAYARMPLVHGWNPYTQTQLALRAAGDPTAPYLQWDIPSPYGPLWTLLSMALVAPLVRAPLWLAVVIFKLLAAAALLFTAATARRVAERLTPGRGELAAAAIVACPLFLIEGPGNGHNDLVLVALLLAGLRLSLESRARAAALALGASVAIKWVTAPVLLFFAVRALRTAGPRAAAATMAWGLLPLAVGTLAFGTTSPPRLPALPVLLLLGGAVTLGLAWVAVRTEPHAWLGPWIAYGAATAVLAPRIPFPWYLTWALAPALVRWGPRQAWASAALLVLALAGTWAYTIDVAVP